MKMNVRRFQDMAKEVKNLRQMNQSQTLAGTNNIIHLEEVIASERSYYLVFEYCNGGDLRDMLKAQYPLKPEVIIHIVRSIANALQVLHHCDIIHRDLKPENVLLTNPLKGPKAEKDEIWNDPNFDQNVTVKLADLGISKTIDQNMGTQTQIGTESFMAPEIFIHDKYDTKADVWALGSLLFELLTF